VTAAGGTGRTGGTLGRGVRQTAGFALGMVVLAVASLLLVPALIAAGGPRAWGAVAVGQSVGTVAAVLIGLGWGVSGPAVVARAGTAVRRREFLDAVLARGVVAVPVVAVAAGLAAVLAPGHRPLAALAAVALSLVGLSANWYFVGTAAPWALLLTETVPRAAGSLVGVTLLHGGAAPAVGIGAQAGGILVGVLASTLYVTTRTRAAGPTPPRRTVRRVIAGQRHGVATTVLSAAYGAAPVLLVSLLSPAALPVYALVDKLQRQVYVAATPVVVVLQGWVARASGRTMRARIRRSHVLVLAATTTGGALVTVLHEPVFDWFGAGEVEVPVAVVALAALWLLLNLQESVAARVALVPLGRIDLVARVTAIGTAVGLTAVAVLTVFWGAVGALVGICLGLVLRLTLCLYGARAGAAPSARPVPDAVHQEVTT